MIVWLVTFSPVDNKVDDAVRIRGLLKTAFRRHGMKCLDLKRVDDAAEGDPENRVVLGQARGSAETGAQGRKSRRSTR